MWGSRGRPGSRPEQELCRGQTPSAPLLGTCPEARTVLLDCPALTSVGGAWPKAKAVVRTRSGHQEADGVRMLSASLSQILACTCPSAPPAWAAAGLDSGLTEHPATPRPEEREATVESTSTQSSSGEPPGPSQGQLVPFCTVARCRSPADRQGQQQLERVGEQAWAPCRALGAPEGRRVPRAQLS